MLIFLLGFLLLALFCLTVLVRALLLFPLRGLRQGWEPALRRYGLSLLLCAGVVLWELGALYGFSWQQLGRADRRQMVDTAVAYAYPEAYGSLTELRRDYAHFRPEVSYWDNWEYEGSTDVLDKLLGDTHYQIRLPDMVVVADVHGQPLRYFDGTNWLETWDSSVSGTVPKAVEVTIRVRSEFRGTEEFESFRTAVWMPVAAAAPGGAE